VLELKHEGVIYYFLDNEYYYKRAGIYGHNDDGERFSFFARAIAELMGEMDWHPDVVHLNDWQTALVPIYMKELSGEYPVLSGIKSVFTIHNIEYQGRFSKDILGDVCGLPQSWYDSGVLEFMDSLSMMKGALMTSDYVTTVSPTYAEELKYSFFAKGLEGVIDSISGHFRGILNGIDVKSYDPASDPSVVYRYDPETRAEKAKNKRYLQRLLNLTEDPDAPVVSCVGRLVSIKGMDLVVSKLDGIMAQNVQFVLLGTGDYEYEQFFKSAQGRYPGRLSANIMFSEELARRIYAGSDIFLMPSQKEPCGLSQMIAMRYGALPVVRETGGLKDSVGQYNAETGEGNGFTFTDYNADDMLEKIYSAVKLYKEDRTRWDEIVKRNMETDFSWARSAAEYMRLYADLTGMQ
jgi:starch synthase